jgi:dihydrofolate reductase
VKEQDGDGEILAHGGARFLASLASLDVAGEYRLTVLPYIAGTGVRLFGTTTPVQELELIESLGFANGVAVMRYWQRR